MKVWTGTFVPHVGTTDQTVTGIVDRDGAAFTPEWIFFNNNLCVVNTLASAGTLGSDNAFGINSGLDNGTVGASGGTADRSQFGVRTASGAGGSRYSLLDVGANAFFGGDIYRRAYVSAIGSGQFTVTYDANDHPGDTVVVHAFAATSGDLTIETTDEIVTGLNPPVPQPELLAKPQGILRWHTVLGMGSVPTAGTGAGGESWGYGWWTRSDSNGEAAAVYFQGPTYAYQRSDYATSLGIVESAGPVTSRGPEITSWGDRTYQANVVNTGLSKVSVIFEGDYVVFRSGSFTQNATTGLQTIDLGLDAYWVMLQTVGQLASTVVETVPSELCIGFTNGPNQSSLWTGESGSSPDVKGARYLSDNTILRMAGNNIDGASTTFHSVAELSSLNESGQLTRNWTSSDGGNAQIQWFAIGTRVPGSLTVRKVVTGPSSQAAQTFDFTAGGGLVPGTFTLGNTDTQDYTDLTPGSGYSIEETPVADWTTSYDVSNDSPNDNITINDGEDVTVIVRNTWSGVLPGTPPWKLYRFDIKPRKEAKS